MSLLTTIADLAPADAAFVLAAMDNLRPWLGRDPHTREEYEASIRAMADYDMARERLRICIRERS